MRYLTLSANYTESALRDDHLGSVAPEEIDLPEELADRICDWKVRYRRIIPLSVEERAEEETAALIDALDEEGLGLVKAISEARPDFKVRYFSEGHLRWVP